jgi:hypothetical protein
MAPLAGERSLSPLTTSCGSRRTTRSHRRGLSGRSRMTQPEPSFLTIKELAANLPRRPQDHPQCNQGQEGKPVHTFLIRTVTKLTEMFE